MSLLDNINSASSTQAPEMVIPLEELIQRELTMGDVYNFVYTRYDEARRERRPQEQIWLDSTRAWTREYSPEEKVRIAAAEARNPGASRIFINITKTKVQSSYSQIIDILFSSKNFPITIEPTPIPEGVAESIYLEPESLSGKGNPDVMGYKGDGKEIPPGTTQKTLLAGYADKIGKFLKGQRVVEGSSPDKTKVIEMHPAEECAWQMNKLIQDQLCEDDAEYALRRSIFECVLLGSGVFKGPTGTDKTYHHWEQDPGSKQVTYTPESKFVPKFTTVRAWDFYPDPHANSRLEWDYTVERHLFNRTQLRDLKNNPTFDSDAIERVLKMNPSYASEYWENQIKETNLELNRKRYEVLEYWGYLDEALAQAIGLTFDINQSNMVNIWITNGEVIRAIVNPFSPQRFPYYVVPYEEHPYQIWGVGVAENMKDTQALMNGHMRLAIDNLRFAGNQILEVNENQLAPGQDLTLYPGKVFRKQGGAPGQSIYGITFPDVSQNHMKMFDKARELSDETTGIPSFQTGSGQVSSAIRSAASMSMVMGAAALNIKTVVRNIDYYLLQPLGEQLYQWNMQFNQDDVQIRGDMEVKAGGTAALMQKEVQSQRLLSLVQVSSNPVMAPYLNAEYVYKEIAKSMDLDPDKVVNDPQTASLYAQTLGAQNANGQTTSAGGTDTSQQGGQASPQPGAGGINPANAAGHGAGNIGAGSASLPGQPGHSANTQVLGR